VRREGKKETEVSKSQKREELMVLEPQEQEQEHEQQWMRQRYLLFLRKQCEFLFFSCSCFQWMDRKDSTAEEEKRVERA